MTTFVVEERDGAFAVVHVTTGVVLLVGRYREQAEEAVRTGYADRIWRDRAEQDRRRWWE